MLNIRPATPNDDAVILDLIRGLALYERAPEQVTATEADIRRDLFEPNPKFRCIIAEWDGKPVGFAFFFYNYSTWQGRRGLYLEDLFVYPEFRGKGIGKALLLRLAQIAVDEGCGRFQWQVLDWNTPAIDFYKSLGAKVMNEWLTMRVEGDDLLRMASMTK